MTTHRKPTAREELERIEDALVESLVNATEHDLREELAAAGGDPDACVAEIEAAIVRARAECVRLRLKTARTELAGWRSNSGQVTGDKREGARARLQRLRTSDRDLDSRMTLAARKGADLSERDVEGLLEDMADLERLENEEGDG
jgi:hypothetical protein